MAAILASYTLALLPRLRAMERPEISCPFWRKTTPDPHCLLPLVGVRQVQVSTCMTGEVWARVATARAKWIDSVESDVDADNADPVSEWTV